MTRLSAAIIMTTFLAVFASSALAKDDAALRTAVESYIQHPVTQSALDSMLSTDTLRSQLFAQLQARGATLRSDQIEVLTQITKEELNQMRPQLEILTLNAALETYSLEEIQALNDFLNTDSGASAMSKTGKLMRLIADGSGPLLQQLFERLGTRIDSEFPN